MTGRDKRKPLVPPPSSFNNIMRDRARFDRKYGPGASEKLVSDRNSDTDERVAERLGRTTKWLRSWYGRITGGQTKPRVSKYAERSDLTAETIRRAAARSTTIAELARNLATSHDTLHRRARELGIALPTGSCAPPRPTPKLLTAAMIRSAIERSRSTRDIAWALGVSPATVRRYARELGITLPQRAKPVSISLGPRRQ